MNKKNLNNKFSNPIVTYCYFINVQECLNYDLVFPFLNDNSLKELSNKKGITLSKCSFSILNRETLEKGNEKETYVFRCRLKGVSQKVNKNSLKRKSDELYKKIKKAKNFVIDFSNDTYCLSICKISGFDQYSRLLVDIYHTVTGYSLKTLLLKNYPQILDQYK